MSKPPAFQLYAADFLVDTMDWSATQVGIYFRLLMYEWVNGSIPNDCIRMARIAGIDVGNFKKCYLQDIEKKFIVNGGGELINLRLEKTREKQENYRKSQTEKSKLGVEARQKAQPVGQPAGQPAGQPNGKSLQSSSSTLKKKNIYTSNFETFWKEYPRKIGKGAALKAWKRNGIPDLDILLTALSKQKKSKQWEDSQFIPHPATWLNQGRWEDETEEVKKNGWS